MGGWFAKPTNCECPVCQFCDNHEGTCPKQWTQQYTTELNNQLKACTHASGEEMLEVPFCKRDQHASDTCTYSPVIENMRFQLEKKPVEGECISDLCGGVDHRKGQIDFEDCTSGKIFDLRTSIANIEQSITSKKSEIAVLKAIENISVQNVRADVKTNVGTYANLATGAMTQAAIDMEDRLGTCTDERDTCDYNLVRATWEARRDKDLLDVATAAGFENWPNNEYELNKGVYAKFPAIGTCSGENQAAGRTTLLECGYQVNKLFTDNGRNGIVRAECAATAAAAAAPVPSNEDGFTPLPYFAKCPEHEYEATGNLTEMYTFPGQNQQMCEKTGRVHLAECLNELAKASCLSTMATWTHDAKWKKCKADAEQLCEKNGCKNVNTRGAWVKGKEDNAASLPSGCFVQTNECSDGRSTNCATGEQDSKITYWVGINANQTRGAKANGKNYLPVPPVAKAVLLATPDEAYKWRVDNSTEDVVKNKKDTANHYSLNNTFTNVWGSVPWYGYAAANAPDWSGRYAGMHSGETGENAMYNKATFPDVVADLGVANLKIKCSNEWFDKETGKCKKPSNCRTEAFPYSNFTDTKCERWVVAGEKQSCTAACQAIGANCDASNLKHGITAPCKAGVMCATGTNSGADAPSGGASSNYGPFVTAENPVLGTVQQNGSVLYPPNVNTMCEVPAFVKFGGKCKNCYFNTPPEQGKVYPFGESTEPNRQTYDVWHVKQDLCDVVETNAKYRRLCPCYGNGPQFEELNNTSSWHSVGYSSPQNKQCVNLWDPDNKFKWVVKNENCEDGHWQGQKKRINSANECKEANKALFGDVQTPKSVEKYNSGTNSKPDPPGCSRDATGQLTINTNRVNPAECSSDNPCLCRRMGGN